jgi:hypothetical protein
MQIRVKIDAAALKARTEREAKRLAFSTAQALNETAKEIQTAERVNLDRKFTIRKAGFMYHLIKITAFASPRKGRPFAEVAIDPTKKRVLLGIFERGGERLPAKGKNVAVPVTGGPARPTFPQPVQEQFTFKALKLRRKQRRRAGAQPQIKGQQHTFLIPGAGVFQRVRDTVRAVYLFIRRPKLDKRLEFEPIARRIFSREWEKQFRKAFQRKESS